MVLCSVVKLVVIFKPNDFGDMLAMEKAKLMSFFKKSISAVTNFPTIWRLPKSSSWPDALAHIMKTNTRQLSSNVFRVYRLRMIATTTRFHLISPDRLRECGLSSLHIVALL